MKNLLISVMGLALLAACAPVAVAPEAIDAPDDATVTAAPPTATALPAGERPPAGASAEFSTDFSISSVPFGEILSGGPPKDGIPPIDTPEFIPVRAVDVWLRPQEPVIVVQANGDARAYPIQILMWHEIVNDTVGGIPLVVTFCPLCNTAIVFERVVGGEETTFGTTGRLRYSNLIMYDRLTETWWQQANGEAIVGLHTGEKLAGYPAAIVSWQEFKESHPEGLVLSRETGFRRNYGRNPYAGYDDVNSSPFLYRGPAIPGQLLPMARVLTVDLNGEAVAYPYDVLAEVGVVNDVVGGEALAIFSEPDTRSALDAPEVAAGRKVGSLTAYSAVLDGQTLQFEFVDGEIRDVNTGSTWNTLGLAVAGPLAGQQLTPVVSINHFWFSWAAFRPETRVYAP